MERVECAGCNSECLGDLCCPNCLQYGKSSFFCSQLCFEANWQSHVAVHAEFSTISRNVQRDIEPLSTAPDGNDSIQTVHVEPVKDLELPNGVKQLLQVESPKLYDVESNNTNRGGQSSFQLTKWVGEAASRLVSSLDANEASQSTRAARRYLQRQLKTRQGMVKVSGSKVFLSHRLNRLLRNGLIIISCFLLFFVCYFCSVRIVDFMDKERGTFIQEPSAIHADPLIDLHYTMEQMRLEIARLRENVYSNSVAIYSLSQGSIKVAGSGDTTNGKRGKFTKTGQNISSGSNRVNINVEQPAPQENAQTPDGPVAILHDAPVAQTSVGA
ncbi:MYND-like zinc finger [Babesia duncani]|uniref:MYND-like zinc finger n=1 Tax=Babesia duncani TaxID=323732 RepID=A0AAD9PMW8_9APIC|nr:MYND-like zinc finger [Babesia duncani]